MKATGIVRRVDDLGRIVIPREIRHRLNIKEGQPVEVFIEDDCIVLKRYDSLENSRAIIENAIVAIENDEFIELDTQVELVAAMKGAIDVLEKNGGK